MSSPPLLDSSVTLLLVIAVCVSLVRVEASVHEYVGQKLVKKGNAFVFHGGSEGIYSSSPNVNRSSRSGAARFFAAGAKPRAGPFPFCNPTQKPPSLRISRSPVEMSFAVESMLPFHTATACSLLTSMLSVSPRTYGWTLEDLGEENDGGTTDLSMFTSGSWILPVHRADRCEQSGEQL